MKVYKEKIGENEWLVRQKDKEHGVHLARISCYEDEDGMIQHKVIEIIEEKTQEERIADLESAMQILIEKG